MMCQQRRGTERQNSGQYEATRQERAKNSLHEILLHRAKDTSRGIPKRLYKHLLSLPDVTQKLRRISMGKFAFRGCTPNSEVQEFGVRPRNARQGGPNMKRRLFILTTTSLRLNCSVILIAQAQRDRPPMSFFLTSKGSGGGAKLGGIAGADYNCQTLAGGV